MATMTNAGKAAIAGLFNGVGSVTAFTYLAYGDDDTAEDATHTKLVGTESQREEATCTLVTTTVTNDTSQLVETFDITETETIGEVAVFNADTAGTMALRGKLSPERSVISGDTWTATVKVKFS